MLGVLGAPPADQLTLSQPEGQIMPTILMVPGVLWHPHILADHLTFNIKSCIN